jgi:hypothetical protein
MSFREAVRNPAINGIKTRVRVSGGSVGRGYRVSNQVTLATGLKYERSFLVLVREL